MSYIVALLLKNVTYCCCDKDQPNNSMIKYLIALYYIGYSMGRGTLTKILYGPQITMMIKGQVAFEVLSPKVPLEHGKILSSSHTFLHKVKIIVGSFFSMPNHCGATQDPILPNLT